MQLPRGGMQVHAVPEHERYIDGSGKRMPWAYERADLPELSPGRREPVEKGPFGRSNRRRGTSRSRSKTAEPRREEDRIRAENTAAEDAIFGRLKVEPREKEKGSDRNEGTAAVPKTESKEPTEVLLYGFGEDLMWAAIDFYERVSNGIILEDYERQPPGKQEPLARSLSRATAQKSLSRASLRRKNIFSGGSHWIKVTFDSAEAADLAIARSPHTIKGHLVYAEPYRGTGPGQDDAVYASSLGAQITSTTVPKTYSTKTPEASPRSETATSGTLATEPASRTHTTTQSSAIAQGGQIVQRQTRIQGATRAVLLPAEQALLPKQSRQPWSAWVGSQEVIGSALPRKEDGTFDWDKAGLYWRIFFWIDMVLGTDLCGLRGDE
ncbi:hypothetical protein AMS68_006329 [Peltaster fructicola]|uniref:RRM Nup35-type domain-containing protein n=1 Tax=Peltaster fructicola TaxID=286661 RepID=A0A6H0Y1A4_9PEZI|nr:hypothetical protein AMS68_006329 [Peltaster fructicola]